MNRPSILILLPWEPSIRYSYQNLILGRFPDLKITTVDTVALAEQEIENADIFMAFGVAVKKEI